MIISVIIPSLNQGRYLEECLTSILNQQFDDLQLIVIDGGSTDQSSEILKRYSSEISHLVIEPDDGQADALAKGFSLADGDIQCYLNSDDYLLPGTLKFVHQFFHSEPKVDAIYADRVVVDETGSLSNCWLLPRHVRYLMERWDYIPQESCFWRRTLYEKTRGIDPRLQFAMDYDLFVQFMRKGNVKHVDTFLAAFRDHSDSKTRNLNDTIGQSEVRQIQSKYNIRRLPFDRISGGLLRRYIEYRSNRFLRSNPELLKLAAGRSDA